MANDESGPVEHEGQIPPDGQTVDATSADAVAALRNALENATSIPNAPQSAARNVIEASLSVSAAALPFVPPDILREYEDAYPGIGAKLIEWTDDQRRHRMTLEERTSVGTETRKGRQQVGALIIALFGLGVAGYVAQSSGFAASVIAIASVGGPLAAQLLAMRFGTGSGTPPRMPPIAVPRIPPG